MSTNASAKYITAALLQGYLDSGNPVAEEWPGVNSTTLYNALAVLKEQLRTACYDRLRWQALHRNTRAKAKE